MTMMSMPIASMLRAVSISVSPLLTLLVFLGEVDDVGAEPLSGQREAGARAGASPRRTR